MSARAEPEYTPIDSEILRQIRTHLTHARVGEAIQQLLDSQRNTSMYDEIWQHQITFNGANSLGGNWETADRPNIVKPILTMLERIEKGK